MVTRKDMERAVMGTSEMLEEIERLRAERNRHGVELRNAVYRAVLNEREACAMLSECIGEKESPGAYTICNVIAEAIRERNKTNSNKHVVPHRINYDRTAVVSSSVEYMPMDTCPRNGKVILLGAGGVATIGEYNGRSDFWVGWHPLPRRAKSTAEDCSVV